ncbi:guanine nucleotide-binding protein-like 1 [Lepisosteus oculatus]|uniref:guanine nucleotide-binding protein-like 1 n=1 Tax=Lepisosteus oculatus TaxID=7918 RepID=UPI0035F52755
MPRKKPFSTKQKKKQLQHRRGRKRGETEGPSSRSCSVERPEGQSDTSDSESLSLEVQHINQQPQSRQSRDRGHDPNRYRLHLEKESREEVDRRKRMAQERKLQLLSEDQLEIDIEDVYRPGSVLDFPRRQPWDYGMSKEQVLAREERAFREYLDSVYKQYQPSELSYFEHNLETWRQLWRVLEMSDIVLLLTDIRHPVLHFPPALYDCVTREMRRSLVLVLNKIDLAPPALVVAWRHHLRARFPEVRVVCFTSYPQRPGEGLDPGAVLKRRRRRRRGGWGLAVGPMELLRACEDITAGRVDLSSWRQKIQRDAVAAGGSEEEEEEGEEGAVLVEHHSDVAMEMASPSQERYKDGVLTLGCVGFPNVGKSSLINGLVGRKVVSVSRTPGHTKYFQTYFLTPTVKLCDCPGLIFPSLVDRQQQVLAGIYPVSQIQEPYSSVGYLASRVPIPALLKLRHPSAEGGSEEPPWTAWDICEAWAEKRGYKTAKAARNDVYRAANSLLRLATDGRLCLCLRPPAFSTQQAVWEAHPETAEIAALQAAQQHGGAGGSEEEEEEEEEEEASSSGPEEEEGAGDADAEDEEEERAGGPRRGAGDRPTQRNMFSLLGEDECL